MFHRFTAKWPVIVVGLFALVSLTTSQAARYPTSRVTPKTGKARVSAPAAVRTPAKSPVATKGPVVSKKPVATKAKPTTPDVKKPTTRELIELGKVRPGRERTDVFHKNSHGGNPATDGNLDGGGPTNEIQPAMFPGSSVYVLSSDRSFADNYPNPEVELLGPAFLAGADYHLYLSVFGDDRRLISLGLEGEDRGEQFEPNVAADSAQLAFSAFFPGDNEIYQPETAPGLEGNVEVTDPGMPVRVIAYSENAFEDAPTITKILSPAVGGAIIEETGTEDDPEQKVTPILIPDATPVWFPSETPRFIVFVSLRGYKANDPTTHYTSLWLWDTSVDQSASNPRRILSMPEQSILNPKFNEDGSLLAFTVCDLAFDTIDDFGNIADPIHDTDVTKANLAKPFLSRVWVAQSRATGNSVSLRNPMQATVWVDAENEMAPRDMMPFWNSLNQLGFSSDRIDSDNDLYADKAPEDPTTALFSIYQYAFPYDPDCMGEDAPDATARRVTLGDGDIDDANELLGAALPINDDAGAFGLLQPRVIYQSDDAGAWDIWFTDKSSGQSPNGNILTGLPIVTGNPDLEQDKKDLLAQTYRVGLPGDFVNIEVAVNPSYLEYDMEQALTTKTYVVIKDPDQNIFQKFKAQVNPGITIDVNRELDATPVRFCKDDFDNWTKLYADVEDAPKLGAVIELTPDPVRIGVFRGKWYTPLEVSDFLMDVMVQNTTQGYVADSVGGFSTSPFIAQSRTLLVSDFAAAQKSIYWTTNTLTTTGVPTESYFTYRPFPSNAVQNMGVYNGNNPIGPRTEWQEMPNLGVDPVSGRTVILGGGMPNLNDPLTNTASPFGNLYDMWRVQCREPITAAILDQYRPYIIDQPGYPNTKTVRKQRIADRCVIWFAPHCGQLNGNAGQNSTPGNGGVNNKGFGTIANLTTQNLLVDYLTADTKTKKEAGRLMVNGDDVAFTLTQDGNIASPLLDKMKVAYESHFEIGQENGGVIGQRTEINRSIEGESNGLNPIPWAAWQNLWIDEPNPNSLQLAPYWAYVPFTSGRYVYHPRRTPPDYTDTREDGAWTNLFIDSVKAVGAQPGQTGAVQLVWNYATVSDTPKPNREVAGVQAEVIPGLTENTSSVKSLFFPFGLEGIHRWYYISDNVIHSPNRPAQIMHNTIDWLTTGTMIGQVYINNNVAKVKDILVRAVDDYNQRYFGTVRGTAKTDADGTFRIEGLDSSIYRVFAYRTGYASQNPSREAINSGVNPLTGQDGTSMINVYLIAVQPGTLRGVVTDKATGLGLDGVPVTIQDITATTTLSTVTASLPNPQGVVVPGSYIFTNVPAGLYIVTVPEWTAGEKTYAAYTNETNPVSVTTDSYPAAGDWRGDTVFSFALTERVVPPGPATIVGTVVNADNDPSTPIVGAMVGLYTSLTLPPVVEVETDDQGAYMFADVPSGQYIIKVDVTGYKSQTKSVTAPPNVNTTVPPFVFGGVIKVFPPNVVLMVSAPYDYTGTTGSPITFSNVLNIPDVESLKTKIVAWNAASQTFTFFPTYPADTFHSGRGYGIKLPTEGRIREQGTLPSVSSDGYYIVRGEIGWNLIGNPFDGTVLWTSTNPADKVARLSLRSDSSATKMTITQALERGIVVSPLWGGYTASSDQSYRQVTQMDAWNGYWVKLSQPVLLYIPKPAVQSSVSVMTAKAEKPIARTPLMPNADVWGVNITAQSGDLLDDGLALGISSKGNAGYDAGLDLGKPEPMSREVPYLFTAFHNEWGGQPGCYATDVRGYTANTNWSFTVSTNKSASPVKLTWFRTGTLPSNATVRLVDQKTGASVDMSTTNDYTFVTGQGGETRTFRVLVSRKGRR